MSFGHASPVECLYENNRAMNGPVEGGLPVVPRNAMKKLWLNKSKLGGQKEEHSGGCSSSSWFCEQPTIEKLDK